MLVVGGIPKVNLVHNGKGGNLVKRCVNPSSGSLYRKPAAVRNFLYRKILKPGVPETQKVNVVALNPFNAAKVFKLVLRKRKRAICLNLFADFLHHLVGKLNALIAALKIPCSYIAWEFVVNSLSHAEFVHVRFQQAADNFFHKRPPPFFLGLYQIWKTLKREYAFFLIFIFLELACFFYCA